jgi:hypothetical protein
LRHDTSVITKRHPVVATSPPPHPHAKPISDLKLDLKCIYLASIIWQLQQQLLFSSLSRVCAQTYKGRESGASHPRLHPAIALFNSSGTQTFYTVQPATGFSPTRHFFLLYVSGEQQTFC